jgi:hypothetical protein
VLTLNTITNASKCNCGLQHSDSEKQTLQANQHPKSIQGYSTGPRLANSSVSNGIMKPTGGATAKSAIKKQSQTQNVENNYDNGLIIAAQPSQPSSSKFKLNQTGSANNNVIITLPIQQQVNLVFNYYL